MNLCVQAQQASTQKREKLRINSNNISMGTDIFVYCLESQFPKFSLIVWDLLIFQASSFGMCFPHHSSSAITHSIQSIPSLYLALLEDSKHSTALTVLLSQRVQLTHKTLLCSHQILIHVVFFFFIFSFTLHKLFPGSKSNNSNTVLSIWTAKNLCFGVDFCFSVFNKRKNSLKHKICINSNFQSFDWLINNHP